MKAVTLWLALLTVLAAGCSSEPRPEAASSKTSSAGPLSVFVVNYPLQYFAERIGGEQVKVVLPAPTDGDPAFWSPSAEDVAAYQGADVILLNGAGYARWVDRVSLPASRLVDTSKSFREELIAIDDGVVHSHGPRGDHSHGEIAFTTWLDPRLAIDHAAAIRDALSLRRPGSRDIFDSGFAALEKDLLALDAELRAAFAPLLGKPVLGSHPVYQYLARRYGFDMSSVHFEPGQEPPAKEWRKLEALLQNHPAQWMLWEGEPDAATADRLRELGVESVVSETAGNVPEQGDYLAAMHANAKRVVAAWGSPGS